jgi:hypothetical protein
VGTASAGRRWATWSPCGSTAPGRRTKPRRNPRPPLWSPGCRPTRPLGGFNRLCYDVVVRGLRHGLPTLAWAVALACLIVVGAGIAAAQIGAPTLGTDRSQYTPGQTILFAGHNWACSDTGDIPVRIVPGGITATGTVEPLHFGMAGLVAAPTAPGTYRLIAGFPPGSCSATASFQVVSPGTTTTTTVAPTTTVARRAPIPVGPAPPAPLVREPVAVTG